MIKKILKEYWVNYKKDLSPKDRKMNILEEKDVRGMSTENIRFLLNEIIRRFAKKSVYLEVGIFRGCSLLSAALFNPSTRCIGIDNFSEFNYDSDGWRPSDNLNNEEKFKNNLAKFPNAKNIEWYDGDYGEIIKILFNKEPNLKIKIYFYDGEHSYKNQLEGLKIILPHLSKRSIIVVDDLNWQQVEKANKDFIKENPDFKSVIKIKTKDNCSKDWWNGIEIIARGFDSRKNI
jgi:hypothetical protein